MTEQRKSAVIAKEKTFAQGDRNDGETKYCRLPTGYHIQHSINTPGSSVYETGNKIRVGATYGPVDGSWRIQYVTDYKHLELMTMAYDEVISFQPSTSVSKYRDKSDTECSFNNASGNSGFSYTSVSGNSAKITDLVTKREYFVDLPTVASGATAPWIHLFIQRNNSRPGHYIIREKTLHRIVNERSGAKDEVTELMGAVPASFQISKTSASSEMTAAINGIYADQTTKEENLSATDYESLGDDTMTQQACMWIGSDNSTGHFIEDMDSFTVTTTNQVQLVKNMCSRIAGTYMEGRNSFKWDATTYHNDVTEKFLRRIFTGGASDADRPKNKNLAPLPIAKFMTFNGEIGGNIASREDAYKYSTKAMTIVARNSTLREMTWPMGSGDLMKQNLSSVECDEVYVVVRNDKQQVWDETVDSKPAATTVTAMPPRTNGTGTGDSDKA